MTCPFCRIAAGEIEAVIVHEDDEIVAFLDIAPIRPAHTQIMPRRHIETFERLPAGLAARMLRLGQELAQRMKAVYHVERVAFLFTGSDVPHAHAHVIPMHETTDITSARYIVEPFVLRMSSEHLRADHRTLSRVREELAFVPSR